MAKSERFLEEKFRETGGKRPYVQRLFGRIARVYDLMNGLMSLGLDRYWRTFAARCLLVRPEELGLDLGAGTGDLSIAVIRRAEPRALLLMLEAPAHETPRRGPTLLLNRSRLRWSRSGKSFYRSC